MAQRAPLNGSRAETLVEPFEMGFSIAVFRNSRYSTIPMSLMYMMYFKTNKKTEVLGNVFYLDLLRNKVCDENWRFLAKI